MVPERARQKQTSFEWTHLPVWPVWVLLHHRQCRSLCEMDGLWGVERGPGEMGSIARLRHLWVKYLGGEISRALFKLGETCSIFFFFFNLGSSEQWRLDWGEWKWRSLCKGDKGIWRNTRFTAKKGEKSKAAGADDAVKMWQLAGRGGGRTWWGRNLIGESERGKGSRMVVKVECNHYGSGKVTQPEKETKLYSVNAGSVCSVAWRQRTGFIRGRGLARQMWWEDKPMREGEDADNKGCLIWRELTGEDKERIQGTEVSVKFKWA